MSPIRINMAEAQSNFEPIPNGVYNVAVTGCEIRTSQSSGNPYANWELTVLEGEFQGRKIWTITSFSPRALWRLQATLVAFGEDPDEAKSADYEFDETRWIGAECRVAVDQEAYTDRNGVDQVRNTVTEFFPPATKAAGGSRFR